MKRIMVIAGSDSSGGAGLEADQKVIAVHGAYAMTATSALTAQNTLGVDNIHETPSDFVRQQIEACIDDIGVDAVKTGMLACASTISVVATALRKYDVALSVIDPVMVATTGARLLPNSAVKTMCDELVPKAFLLTPNIPEANVLLKEAGKPSVELQDLEGLKSLANAVLELGSTYVLIKGGHVPLTTDYQVAKTAEDKKITASVLVGRDTLEVIEAPYQNSKNTHGTGDSLASAIACNLAAGNDVISAVRAACRYVDAGIRNSIDLGHGAGPINHFHSLQVLPFAPGYFVDYVLSHDDVKPAWHDFTHHDFVRGMGDGTLLMHAYKHYMIQDYLYLIHFARANALAAYKTKSIDDIAGAASIVTHIRTEMNLHIKECEAIGLSQDQIENQPESQACTAYSRYVLDIGQSEDWLALQVSMLPCLVGYHIIAERLRKLHDNDSPDSSNPYKKWISNYTEGDYIVAVEKGRALVEKHASNQSPKRVEELVKIFIHATKMETGFWDMALGP